MTLAAGTVLSYRGARPLHGATSWAGGHSGGMRFLLVACLLLPLGCSREPAKGAGPPACQSGDARSCYEASVKLAWSGDMAAAVPGFETACTAGEQSACADLGVALSRGEGVTKDQPRAERLMRAACDAQHAKGCNVLGLMLAESGRINEAIQPLRSGCSLGHKQACELLDGACKNDGIQAACR
jgi:hypothetical protein